MESFFFFCDIGCFDPPCVRSPLDTLESGVLFHIWWLSKQLLVLHDSPPWKVASCLPYPIVPSPSRSKAWGGANNYETLWRNCGGIAPHVNHIVDCSPSALLPSGELDNGSLVKEEDSVTGFLCYNAYLSLRQNSFAKKLAGISHEHVLNRYAPLFK